MNKANPSTTNYTPKLPAPRGAVKIAKLPHAYQDGDWHDPKLRYSVSYDGYVQHFPNMVESRKFAKCLRAGATVNEVSNLYMFAV